jgi:hypothetical protein
MISLTHEQQHTRHHDLTPTTTNISDSKNVDASIDDALYQNAALDRSLNRKFDTHILPWLFVRFSNPSQIGFNKS